MTTTDWLRMLVARWWIILLAAMAASLTAVAWTVQLPRTYEAKATVILQPARSITSQQSVVNSLYPLERSRLAPTFVDIASSSSVLDQAADRVNIPRSTLTSYESSAKLLPESLAVEIAVTGPSRANALLLAQQVVTSSSDRFQSAYRAYEMALLVAPAVNPLPVRPSPLLNGMAAFLLGAMLGVVLVLVLERASPRARSRRRLRAAAAVEEAEVA